METAETGAELADTSTQCGTGLPEPRPGRAASFRSPATGSARCRVMKEEQEEEFITSANRKRRNGMRTFEAHYPRTM